MKSLSGLSTALAIFGGVLGQAVRTRNWAVESFGEEVCYAVIETVVDNLQQLWLGVEKGEETEADEDDGVVV